MPKNGNRALLALVGVAGLSSWAWGQCPASWVMASAGQPGVPTDPTLRQNHAMAYDTLNGITIMFGGFATATGFSGETWIWNNASWGLAATSGPAPRGNLAMAYDSARNRLVLFGGAIAGSIAQGDTWEWDGRDWVQIFVATPPPPRFNHAMTFDSVRNVVVMTGGFASARLSDTWEYDGNDWRQRTGTSYGARSSHAMAFDASRNKTVIFGGFNGTRLADTREFDPSTGSWSLAAATGPAGRQYGAMDYDSDQHVLVLFGGQTGPGTVETDRQQDTWVYNGAAWTQVGSAGPARRDQHAMVYDRLAHKLVVFGGYRGGCCGGVAGDTWTSACPQTPPCYANCDGSTTAPILNVNDFTCFLNKYAAGDSYANCDGSTIPPILNVNDFTCFLNQYAAGCP